MANDRMYVYCVGCGEWMYVGKWYPSTGWAFRADETTWLDTFDWFLADHSDCVESPSDVIGPKPFRFGYASDHFEPDGGPSFDPAKQYDPAKHGHDVTA